MRSCASSVIDQTIYTWRKRVDIILEFEKFPDCRTVILNEIAAGTHRKGANAVIKTASRRPVCQPPQRARSSILSGG
ncbi:MAG: hypothetical protein ACLVJ6_13005 [Merdibacter sp.]